MKLILLIITMTLVSCGTDDSKEAAATSNECIEICKECARQDILMDEVDLLEREDRFFQNMQFNDKYYDKLKERDILAEHEMNDLPLEDLNEKASSQSVIVGRFFQKSKDFCNWYYYYELQLETLNYEWVVKKVINKCEGKPKPLEHTSDYVYPEIGVTIDKEQTQKEHDCGCRDTEEED